MYKNKHGFTTITFAAYHKQPHIVNYLSLRFTNLNLQDPLGYLLLTRCILANSFETADRLITRGFDINFRAHDGKTALIQVVMEGNDTGIKFLLERGADPHMADNKCNDACDYAIGSPLYKRYIEF